MAPRVKKPATETEQAPEAETTAPETALESTAVEQAPETEQAPTAPEGESEQAPEGGVDAPEQALGEGEDAPEGGTDEQPETETETEGETEQAPVDLVARKEKVLATLPECVEAGHSWKFAGVSLVSSIKNPFEIIELIKERSSDLVGVIGRVRINRSVVQVDLENVGSRIQFLENIN